MFKTGITPSDDLNWLKLYLHGDSHMYSELHLHFQKVSSGLFNSRWFKVEARLKNAAEKPVCDRLCRWGQ